MITKEGPDHDPIYTVEVIINPGPNKISFEKIFEMYFIDYSSVSTKGRGPKKAIAEMKVAQEMCSIIGLEYIQKVY